MVEGEIGAGKTELATAIAGALQQYDLKVCLILEPVDRWVEVGILKKFYDDPSRFAYSFQTYVYATRIMAISNAVASMPDADVFILERSPATDRIFAALQKGNLDPTEQEMYSTWCDTYDRMLPLDLSEAKVLYLKTGLEQCMSRVSSRDRQGEITEEKKDSGGVSIEYQASLRRAHEAFFQGIHRDEFPDLPSHPFAKIIVLPPEVADGNFRDPGNERERIIEKVVSLMFGL